MDDPDYLEIALKKIERYERNGIFPGDLLWYNEHKCNV